MKSPLFDAFALIDSVSDLPKDGRKINVVTQNPALFEGIEGVTAYRYVTSKQDVVGDICLSSLLLDDDVLDACIEHVYTTKCRLMARACEDLYETGVIESKYRLSPIMLLHKMGLLENATVVGCNHIDRDDLDLMIQSNAEIVFLPSYAMGKGYGIPPISFAMDKLPVRLGTADGTFNPTRSVEKEAWLSNLIASAELHRENAISQELLARIAGGND